ncbi:MAG: hypothetical protein ABI679_11740 [Gemmatimonadota bacterium]
MRKILGLDAFELMVQAVITAGVAGVAGELLFGAVGDASVTGILTASVLILAWRRRRALKGQLPDPHASERVDDLEDRVLELESSQQRVLELEERLDFAERMLARQREPERIPEVPR